MKFSRRLTLGIVSVALLGGQAWAQDWPSKQPIKIVVPYPPGGNADVAARAVAEMAGPALKQAILIDNRPGASTIIGSDFVAKAPADGYTLGVVSDSHAINQAMSLSPKAAEILGAKVPYDAVRDFAPVAGMLYVPLALVVNPKVPARSLKELVQLSKGKGSAGLNFGTMGNGSSWFVQMHQLAKLVDGNFVDVPYKGLAPAATDLIAGQIDVMIMPVHFAQQYVRSGKLVAITTLGTQRHPLLPDTLSLAESGYAGVTFSNSLYFVAPAGTPPAVLERLGREINAALRQPSMRDKLGTSGDPYPAEATELASRLRTDIDAYGAVIKATVR